MPPSFAHGIMLLGRPFVVLLPPRRDLPPRREHGSETCSPSSTRFAAVGGNSRRAHSADLSSKALPWLIEEDNPLLSGFGRLPLAGLYEELCILEQRIEVMAQRIQWIHHTNALCQERSTSMR